MGELKNLTFIQVCPSHKRFVWEVEVMLDNYIRTGYTYPIHNLIFTPYKQKEEPLFRRLEEKFKPYSFIKFFYYNGDEKLSEDTRKCNYIPLLRPYCLEKHFTEHPHLQEEAIFYHDSDILWTRKLDFTPYLSDEINYQSLANSYLDYDYLASKFQHSIPERRHDLLTLKPIETLLSGFGIDVEVLKANKLNTGGAQSLLKNITPAIWKKVYDGSILIRSYFSILNQQYFPGNTPGERENNGWQSWALADMCGLSWTLWSLGRETRCPEDLNFTWATNPIASLRNNYILHNAGVTADIVKEGDEDIHYFFKGRSLYVNGQLSPHKDLDRLVETSPSKCSWWYVQQLLKVEDPIF